MGNTLLTLDYMVFKCNHLFIKYLGLLMSDEVIDRKIAVILVADVVGYSKHMEKDEDATLKAYSECEKILKSLLDKRQGSIFNTAGDSVLAEFPSAVNAVECAVEFQNKIKERNQSEKTTTKLAYRIGINMGDVVSREGNLLGDGVNIAARLEALSQPNGVCISKSIYDLVVPKTKMTFNDLGVQKVKQNSFHAYDILLSPQQKRKIGHQRKNRYSIFTVIVALILLTLVGGYLFIFQNEEINQKPLGIIADKPSILIMPFENQTGREDNEYINLGITQNIITTLSKNEQLFIPSSHTGEFVKKNNLTTEIVKEEYGIDFIIKGFVQGSEERLRALLQMIDTNTNETVWSDVFDFEKNTQIFDVQDKISVAILSKLNVDLNAVTNALERDFSNPKAFQNYIFARSKMLQWTPESHAEAFRLIEAASKLEPNNKLIERFYGYWYWGKTMVRMSENKVEDLEKALQIAENVDDYALAGYAELGLGRRQQACKRPKEMQDSGMLKVDVFNLAAAGRISAKCGELIAAKQYFEKSLSIGPHYAGWVKVAYARLLLRMQLFDEALKFTDRYMGSKFSAKNSELAIQLFRAYALSKTNNAKKAKDLVKTAISQIRTEQTKRFFERTLGSSNDGKFINDVTNTLKDLGVERN